MTGEPMTGRYSTSCRFDWRLGNDECVPANIRDESFEFISNQIQFNFNGRFSGRFNGNDASSCR